LRDEKGEMHSIYTGDTLFIGDVGRPDLAQKVIPDLTQDKLARHLFHSLRNKLMPLPDHLIVYPAHGAGSACGKNMSKETFDSLGNQKRTNYALNPALSEEEFVKEILTGLTPPPAYFPENVLMNIKGYESFDSVLSHGLTALSVEEFIQQAENTDALILDTRKPADFVKGFIPNSINIGVDGQFAVWVGISGCSRYNRFSGSSGYKRFSRITGNSRTSFFPRCNWITRIPRCSRCYGFSRFTGSSRSSGTYRISRVSRSPRNYRISGNSRFNWNAR
jgi:hypothetical protein